MRLSAVGRLEWKEDSKNRFHGKQIAKSKVKILEFCAGITLKNVTIYSFFTSSQIIASPKGCR